MLRQDSADTATSCVAASRLCEGAHGFDSRPIGEAVLDAHASRVLAVVYLGR